MKKQSFKKQLTHLLAVTVLTASSLGGIALVASPTVSAATVSTSKIKLNEKDAVKSSTNSLKIPRLTRFN